MSTCKREDCSKEFEPTTKTHVYCSKNCRNVVSARKKRAEKKVHSKDCTICGEVFEPINASHIYCSVTCRNRASEVMHKDQRKVKMAARRAQSRKASFKGSDEEWYKFAMEETYSLARLRTEVTGIQWDVDHIVPLNSSVVCGLHSPANLQVIPRTKNLKKSNKWYD